MSLLKTTLAFAVLSSTVLTGAESAACGGGGFRGGYAAPRSFHRAPSISYQRPVHQPPVYQQPAYQPQIVQQPFVQQPVVQRPVIQQPVIQAPTQPQIAPQPVPSIMPRQAVAVTPSVTATQSALGALAAMAGVAAPQLEQPGHVGAWSASVNGTNRVQLQLDASGAFRWTANSAGKVSSFAGTYTLAGGQLTLVRSDSQQLAGAWSADANGGFRFKLGTANDNGLLFVRG